MKFIVAIVLCATFILVSGNTNKTTPVQSPIEPGALTTGGPTSPNPIISTTPAPPVTTTAMPTPTTPKLLTTTSSTPKPTSTSTPILTSTPTTTSTSTPTTTPTPTPVPQTGQWVLNVTNNTCIILRMSAEFHITYPNTTNTNATKLLILPSNNSTNVTGSCGKDEQVIQISWGLNNNASDMLSFHFVKNETKHYSLHHIELHVPIIELPNIKSNNTLMLIHNISEYKTQLSNSYRCARLQKIPFTSNLLNTSAILDVTDFHFQAFRTENSTTFGLAEDCAVETQDIVPIAVGCALIILVVIVLAAYLVGRRRRQAGGYLSM